MNRASSSLILCLHCGAPAGAESSFCCQGCATVYSLLKGRGLDEFYRLQGQGLPPRPALPSDEGFAHLDDPEFVREYAFGRDRREMQFYVEGVHCAGCVWLTEKLPDFVPGVESSTLDLATGLARIRIRPDGSYAAAAAEISRLGYRPHAVKLGDSDELRKKEDRKHLIQLGIAGMVSGNIMLLAVALYAGASGSLATAFRWASFVLYLPVLFYSATPFFRGAWASLRRFQVSIDVPIAFGLAVGTAVSFANLLLGAEHIYFDSLAALVFLLLSTRYLLRKVNQRSLGAAALLVRLAPERARKLDPASGHFIETKTDALHDGDLIQVLPGECLPVDGIVVEGSSAVNCALLTGEPEHVGVSPGGAVSAGTWNQAAPLLVRVTASGAGTRLGKIVRSMEQSLASKAPIMTYMDRVGQAFVWAVLVLTAVAFFLGLQMSWHEAVNRALATAIVVCPCTFALATPLAMSLAIGRCARNGVLVKGADVIERLSQIRRVFFDKTGTLTHGDLRIVGWRELEKGASEALLALELRSAHPIAKAVQHFFSERLRALPEVAKFEERAGLGVSGWIQGSWYEVRGLAGEGHSDRTWIALYKDGAEIGRASLSDTIRSDSKSAVEALHALGLEVHLLSGDAAQPAERVALELGISQVHVVSSARPETKAAIIKSSPFALMVGDGANDAIALASAHTSVAVQGGMEISMKAAGVYSSRPGIGAIAPLIVTARETFKVIHRNLGIAIFYNIVGVSVALSGRLDPLFAAVLMPASALTVLLSTMAGTRALRNAFSGKELIP